MQQASYNKHAMAVSNNYGNLADLIRIDSIQKHAATLNQKSSRDGACEGATVHGYSDRYSAQECHASSAIQEDAVSATVSARKSSPAAKRRTRVSFADVTNMIEVHRNEPPANVSFFHGRMRQHNHADTCKKTTWAKLVLARLKLYKVHKLTPIRTGITTCSPTVVDPRQKRGKELARSSKLRSKHHAYHSVAIGTSCGVMAKRS
eukprot:m.170946 g.170946  ORF g.170946 m.170946 type:complete len:205 (-) comp14542_c0_seq1:484-1098(-)